jgi:NADPH-dependent 2,4-dienoyl-CoA reductase/sulfur reductase-like enzyme
VKPIIIVGAGLAALRTAEALRASAWNGPITDVGEEVHPPYNRPPLSKQALRGGLAQADLASVAEPVLLTSHGFLVREWSTQRWRRDS